MAPVLTRAGRFLVVVLALASRALANGAPGVGFDVLDYTFELTLSDASDALEGRAVLLLRLDDPGEPAVELDLAGPADDGRGMTVLEVTDREGASLAFEHVGERLRIALPEVATRLRTVAVRYVGVPRDGLIVGANRYGERTFFSDNWPQGARQWLPTVDHPADKARCAFVVTAPAHYQVVANGRLVEELDLSGDLRLTRWETEAPISTKVMALGVARFAVRHGGEVLGVPVQAWLFPADRQEGLADLAAMRGALRFFAEQLGPFPYAKLAVVQSTTRYGGMENAGAVFLSEERIGGAERGDFERLLAHEVAHQWFGDSLTESDWHELWLSEGFATYFAALYLEASYGRRRLAEEMARSRERLLDWTAEHPGVALRPAMPPPPDELLNANTYQKGAWVLHMLRGEVGEDAFWRAMTSYYRQHRDGTVSTNDVRRAVEESSGRELDWFFRQWLELPGHPVLAVESRFEPATAALDVVIRQVQAGPPFRGTLDVEARGADQRRERFVVELRQRESRLSVDLEWPPESVGLDPDVRLLFEEASPTPAGAAARIEAVPEGLREPERP